MRALNGTGANRATSARIRKAVMALGARDARRLEEIIYQAQADLDEAFEMLEAAGAGTISDGLLGAFVKSTRDLDRFQRAVVEAADRAEAQNERENRYLVKALEALKAAPDEIPADVIARSDESLADLGDPAPQHEHTMLPNGVADCCACCDDMRAGRDCDCWSAQGEYEASLAE